MVIDVHMKNVNSVNKMSTVSIKWKRKPNTVTTIIRGKIETHHTQIHDRSLSLYTWTQKRGGGKIKTVLIIFCFIGNLSLNNL
jgi:hypothetical protein